MNIGPIDSSLKGKLGVGQVTDFSHQSHEIAAS
jgi:hypothetical protein